MLPIPSILSASRLVMTVPAVLAILRGDWTTAFVWCSVAGFTDVADGWVARRFHMQTRAGAWLDPVADKVLVSALYVCLTNAGVVPLWLVVLVISRDVLILSMAGYAIAFTSLRDFPPSFWGKLSTTLQITNTAVAMASQVWASAPMHVALQLTIAAATAGTFWSGVAYVRAGIERLRQLRADEIP